MLAKLENYGPFHILFTLICADRRWAENFTTIFIEKGWTIIWNCHKSSLKKADKVEVEVKTQNGEVGPLAKYKEKYADESLHEPKRKNVIAAARNLVHRVDTFRQQIMKGSNIPMCNRKYSWKVEFQGRGSGHIYGTLWVNLNKIMTYLEPSQDERDLENEKDEESKQNELERAFKTLREGRMVTQMEPKQEEILIKFVDKISTCTLNPSSICEQIDEDSEKVGKEIVDIAKEVQVHSHTKTCRKKNNNKCRFNFPKLPMWKTIIAGEDKENTNRKKKNA